MTSNFLSFKEFVERKFESMSNFSFLATGSFQAYKGLENKLDTSSNRLSIQALHGFASMIDFDKEKCEVSDFDRLAIKARMEHIVETRQWRRNMMIRCDKTFKWPKYKKSDWLRENKISPIYYSAVINGRIVRKNCAYERLIKLMGL